MERKSLVMLIVDYRKRRTEHAPMRGPRFEDQCGRCVVTYPYHLGAARQEVQDPVAEGGV